MKINPYIVSKLFIIWIAIIYIILTLLVHNSSPEDSLFYRIGPHDSLKILGVRIDTNLKYFGLIFYSFINSIFRATLHNYISPWMINNVQDEEKSKKHLKYYNVFEMTTISVIYTWTDWLIYMNILLTQIDMMIIEVSGDLIMSYVTTYYYLQCPLKIKFSNLLVITLQ
ncbi:MAG: hypothetical protein WD512_14985, partial [Candidatus Paceibacterota bacterium]